MSIYSEDFKKALLIEEQKAFPEWTINNITDSLCNDRVEIFIKYKGAELLLQELKVNQGASDA